MLADRRSGQRLIRGVLADDGDDVVARDQLRDHGGRVFGAPLIVLDDQSDLAALDATGSIDLVRGKLDAL